MTLFSFASRQIWPQVLGFLHGSARPDRLVLFHTSEEFESAGPARRLRDFFVAEHLLPADCIELVPIAHDHFGNISETLGAAAERLQLDDSNLRLHFTGGNKLMALAATEWCRLSGTPCFYLERNLRVFPFQPRGGDLLPLEPFQIDPDLAKDIEPLSLLRCQLGGAQIVNPGQRLTLNERGKRLPEVEFGPLLRRNEDFRKFLSWDVAETQEQAGFGLEYAAAVALLWLGVPVVQRSVRLASQSLHGAGREEGELDLVFNWSGKLWVVDCKDRLSAQSKVDGIRTELIKNSMISPRLDGFLTQIEQELQNKELRPLKEDLLAIAEVGGLLGRAICIRKSPLPAEAMAFAESRQISVVLKQNLPGALSPLLFPKVSTSLPILKTRLESQPRPQTPGR